ncbi:MAG: hypothetical protein DRP11_05515 [Candidatus Aenigmatarchaeota archaeon]|nr:MAG: hypothetical protein DRP11_05515 [Candidatus Aenigmarchaeota archaeon]
MEGANLQRADLEGADLRGAHLEGADLTGATGLTKEQIKSAMIDEKTCLPGYLKSSEERKD